MNVARRMWMLTEPVHAVVYFATEHRRAQDDAGLKGGWMAYFAGRSAPLGAVPAEVVTALFYNFAPGIVARAIPDAWSFAAPERVLQARYEGAGRALRRILGPVTGSADLGDAVTLLRAAAEACDVAGRPLFAANRALAWPDEPVLQLWHATTLLREYRGDGHVAALLAHELDGCEAHVMAAAAGATSAEQLRSHRGWNDEQWRAASGRLIDRGLVTGDGRLTDRGRGVHEAIEELTDRLAAAPWERLGEDGIARLSGALQPVVTAVAASETLPYPNPIGVPPPPDWTVQPTRPAAE